MQRILALPFAQQRDLTQGIPFEKRQTLLAGFSPVQRETVLALNNPAAVINNEVQSAKLLRAAYSDRQLEEVLTDFWFNHCNVFIGKGADHYLVTAYERDVRFAPIGVGGAVEIARSVHGQATKRAVASSKAVKHGQRPRAVGGRQFENRSCAVWSLVGGRPIEISRLIKDHAAIRAGAVAGFLKVVQDVLSPARTRQCQLQAEGDGLRLKTVPTTPCPRPWSEVVP